MTYILEILKLTLQNFTNIRNKCLPSAQLCNIKVRLQTYEMSASLNSHDPTCMRNASHTVGGFSTLHELFRGICEFSWGVRILISKRVIVMSTLILPIVHRTSTDERYYLRHWECAYLVTLCFELLQWNALYKYYYY